MAEMETPFQIMGRSMLQRLKETPGRFDFVREHIDNEKSFIELFSFIYDLKESHDCLKSTFMQSRKSDIISNGYRSNGNFFYAKGDLGKALEFYNLSLVLAPHPYLDDDPNMFYGHGEDIFTPERLKPFRYHVSSYCEEKYSALAMAYADRSAVLYQLELYERCLRDIHLAFQGDCPAECMDHLEERMKYCLKALADEHKKTRATSHLENEPCSSKHKESTCSSESKKNYSDSVQGCYRSSEKSFGSDKNPTVLKKKDFLAGMYSTSTPQDTSGSDKDPSNSGRDTPSSNNRSCKVYIDSNKKSTKAGKKTCHSNKHSTGKDKSASNKGRNSSRSNSDRHAPSSNLGRETPSSNLGRETPSSSSGRETPSSGRETPSSGRETPISDLGRETPISDLGRDTPISDLGRETPISDLGRETPISDLGRETPSSDLGRETPSSDLGRETPSSDLGRETPSSNLGRETPSSNISSQTSIKDTSDSSKAGCNSGKETSLSTQDSTGSDKDSSVCGRNTPSLNDDSSKKSSDEGKKSFKAGKGSFHSNQDSTGSDKDSSKCSKDTTSSKKSSQSLSKESLKSIKRSSKSGKSTDKGSDSGSKSYSSLLEPSNSGEISLKFRKSINISDKDSDGLSDDNSKTKSRRSSKKSSLNKISLKGEHLYMQLPAISTTSTEIGCVSSKDISSFKSSKANKVSSHSNRTSCDSGNDSSSMKTYSVTDKSSFETSTKAIDSTNLSQQGCTSDDKNSDTSTGACHLDEKSNDPTSELYDSGSDTVSTGSNEDYENTGKNVKAIKDILESNPLPDYSPEMQKLRNYIMVDDPKPPPIEDPHPLIPAFSSAIRLGYETVKGKSVIAIRYIRPGEVIAVEKAFCLSSDSQRLSYACGYCLKDALDPIPCPGCILVTFCSESCRYEALAEDHWLECAILPTLDALGLHHRNLAYKMLKTLNYNRLMELVDETDNKNTKRKKKTKGYARRKSSASPSSSYRCWENMCTNLEKQTFEYLFVQCQTAFMLTQLLIRCKRFFVDEEGVAFDPSREQVIKTGAVILSNILKVRSNALEIVDKKSKRSMGVGLYHAIGYFNHSCSPAAEEYNCGRTMIIRAIKPITAGEEITISYVWNFSESTKEERAQDLTMYSIACSCDACLYGWGIYKDLPYMALELCRSEEENSEMLTNAIAQCFKIGINVNSGYPTSPEEREILVKTIELLYKYVPVPCQDLCYVQKLLLLSFMLERN
ncbi:uncharacterized protein [Palaemon carinicauda]|uniref:uncharacterized protein n=1 Tax=Palaemon carinicauda TaxID=392227 RepID=UPI0035B60CBE